MPACPRGPITGSSSPAYVRLNRELDQGVAQGSNGIYRLYKKPGEMPRDIDDLHIEQHQKASSIQHHQNASNVRFAQDVSMDQSLIQERCENSTGPRAGRGSDQHQHPQQTPHPLHPQQQQPIEHEATRCEIPLTEDEEAKLLEKYVADQDYEEEMQEMTTYLSKEEVEAYMGLKEHGLILEEDADEDQGWEESENTHLDHNGSPNRPSSALPKDTSILYSPLPKTRSRPISAGTYLQGIGYFRTL